VRKQLRAKFLIFKKKCFMFVQTLPNFFFVAKKFNYFAGFSESFTVFKDRSVFIVLIVLNN
jgi:hypothetical protein